MSSCALCTQPVDPADPTLWRQVVGWERKAAKRSTRRGGSDITLRELRDTYAHDACIQRSKRGLAPAQEGMAL